jgi:hypothetical protein
MFREKRVGNYVIGTVSRDFDFRSLLGIIFPQGPDYPLIPIANLLKIREDIHSSGCPPVVIGETIQTESLFVFSLDSRELQ